MSKKVWFKVRVSIRKNRVENFALMSKSRG